MSNVSPRRAVILAAGLGQRMQPLTLERPKPLLEVAGKSLLDHVLDRVTSVGIDEVIVNCHYLAEQIIAHLIRRSQPRLLISHEPHLLDSGGGVKRVLPWLEAAPFYVINADNVWMENQEPALVRLAAAWNDATMDALMLLIPKHSSIGYNGKGDYDRAADGRLTRRQKKHSSAEFIFGGIVLTHAPLYHTTPDVPFSNTVLWHRAEQQGRLFGLLHEGPWYHVGTPEALSTINALLTTRTLPKTE